jgi:hypothetical protein
MPTEPPGASAGARLLDYLGFGAEVAAVLGGFLLAAQADHLVETVRLGDLEQGGRRAA